MPAPTCKPVRLSDGWKARLFFGRQWRRTRWRSLEADACRTEDDCRLNRRVRGVRLSLHDVHPAGVLMHSHTPPRNRLAKVLPEEWRKMLLEHGAPKRKYTAVCRATLASGRIIEQLIIEEGWIIALDKSGLGG